MHVIDIAYFMKQLNNFDGMFSSMSALDSVGVYRLKKLWSSVSNPEYEAKLADLHFLMESRNKYANYTAALRSASPPKLPYVGHFLGSLFMQSERHPKVGQYKDRNERASFLVAVPLLLSLSDSLCRLSQNKMFRS